MPVSCDCLLFICHNTISPTTYWNLDFLSNSSVGLLVVRVVTNLNLELNNYWVWILRHTHIDKIGPVKGNFGGFSRSDDAQNLRNHPSIALETCFRT